MPSSVLPAPELREKPPQLLRQSRGLLWAPRPLLSDESALRRTRAAPLRGSRFLQRLILNSQTAFLRLSSQLTSFGCSKALCLWKQRHKINPNWWGKRAASLSTPKVLLPQRRNERQAEHDNYSDFAVQKSSHCRPLESHRPGGLRRNGRLWLPLPSDSREREMGTGTDRDRPGPCRPGGHSPRHRPRGFLPPPSAAGAPCAAAEPRGRLILPPAQPSNLVRAGTRRSWWRPRGGSEASRPGLRKRGPLSPAGTGRGNAVSVRTRCRLRPARGVWAGTGLSDAAGAAGPAPPQRPSRPPGYICGAACGAGGRERRRARSYRGAVSLMGNTWIYALRRIQMSIIFFLSREWLLAFCCGILMWSSHCSMTRA